MKRNYKGQFVKGTNGDTFEGFGKWYDRKGYPSIWVNGKSIQLHVFIWERENGERPKGYHIHHIDGNKGNYSLSNLSLESPSDHQKIHAGWLRDSDGNWIKKPCKRCKKLLLLDEFYQRKGLTPLNYCIKCASLNNKEKLKNNKDYREKRRLYLKEYYKKNKQDILKKQRDARKKQ